MRAYKWACVMVVVMLLIPCGAVVKAQGGAVAADGEKSIYYPYWIWDGAAGGYLNQSQADYQKSSSRFSTARMRETKDFVVFWEPGYGDNPETAAAGYRVNLTAILNALESMYDFYCDSLKFVERGHSVTDTYKMVVYLFYNSTFGTVYGAGADDKCGVMLLYPSRLQGAPYGALAHELGHAFQAMAAADSGKGLSGTVAEMTSQYQLWRYYSNWPTFESYHVDAYLKQTHLAFMHPDNQYHSPFVLEYWADLHDPTVVARVWKNAGSSDDMVTSYKKLFSMTQKAFCDEMFDGARRFVTWDLKRGSTIARYANKHSYKLTAIEDGWYRVPASHAPQTYGYNAIRLNVPSAGTQVEADFKGLTQATGYHIVNSNYAGWRYGFVAYCRGGLRVYSDIFSSATGKATFTVPQGTYYLWFVVMGAPTVHQKLSSTPGQWPYEVWFGNTNMYGVKNNPVAVTPVESDDDITLTSAHGTLSITGLTPNASVSVFGINGSLLFTQTVASTSFSTTLPAGLYIIQTETNHRTLCRKVIVR